jgi:hypothetical protein
MDTRYSSRSLTTLQIVIIATIIVIAIIVAVWTMLDKKKADDQAALQPEQKPPVINTPLPQEVPAVLPEEAKSVADYGKLKEPDYKELTRQRKAEYGLDKGVDMIVKADESVRIGDKTISMQEILEKIRIKKGDVVEKSLSTGLSPANPEQERKQLIEELDKTEKRFEPLQKNIESPDSVKNDAAYREYVREHKAIEKTVADYRAYKDAGKDIEVYKALSAKDEQAVKTQLNEDIVKLDAEKNRLEKELEQRLASKKSQPLSERIRVAEKRFEELQKQLSDPNAYQSSEKYRQEYSELATSIRMSEEYRQTIKKLNAKKELLSEDGKIREAIQTKIRNLELWKNSLENDLRVQILPQKDIQVYGIYAVQSGDNVWNIHFNFLKDYFNNRGIRLSPKADKPIGKKSSGVGKILKFAENMVYIYNIREEQVEMNLHQIHPLSKIVVFNLGQVFSVLSQIDYRNINQIEYDGETLWIPAVQ